MASFVQTEERLRLGLRLTPHQVAKARADVLRIVQDNLSLAREVLEGKTVWTPRQITLFLGILNKVLPAAVEPQPGPEVNNDPPDFSVADLRRMLAEVLGEEEIDGSSATAPAAPEPYCERDRRDYFKRYESQHPDRKQQREEARRRRQKSLVAVRTRIGARKAGEAAETMPARAEDDAERRALARRAKRQRWHEVERQIRQAQKRNGSWRRNADPRQSASPENAGPRQSDHSRSAFIMWRGVRLDRLDTPLSQLVADATGGQPVE
jgi:hypothetical protein